MPKTPTKPGAKGIKQAPKAQPVPIVSRHTGALKKEAITPQEGWAVFQRIKKDMLAKVEAGYYKDHEYLVPRGEGWIRYNDSGLEDRLRDFDPLVEAAFESVDPNAAPMVRYMNRKLLVETIYGKPKTKSDIDVTNQQINITIAPWAAGARGPAAVVEVKRIGPPEDENEDGTI